MRHLHLLVPPILALGPLVLACGDDSSQTTANADSTSGGEFTSGPTTVNPPVTTATTTGMGMDSSGTTAGVVDSGSTADPTTDNGTTGDPETGSTTDNGTSSGSDSGSSSDSGSGSGSSDSDTATQGVVDDTIYEIQDGTLAEGVMVDVQGVVVTGVYTNAFYVQEPTGGQYSGVYVFINAAPAVAVGDEVDITGVTEEFNGLTEIDATMGMVTPTGVGGMMLAPELVMLADIGEPWESVLIRIEGAPLTVTDVSQFDEFDVNDGGVDTAAVDDLLYNVLDFPAVYPGFGVGASFTGIQGPLNYSFGEFKVAPREAGDLDGYIPGPPPPPNAMEMWWPSARRDALTRP
ncbi:MAG: hypothetical protein K0V04_30060 [Deltaproteobacteria bacterium]|nr:hypothetical protein [Deltaproteobacteria bacterium]